METFETFDRLSAIDCSDKHKKKGGQAYLPWASAWALVKQQCPDAVYEVVKAENGCIYHTDGKTCWVETCVTIGAESQTEVLAVMDHRNQSITYENITSTAVAKAIKRCLVKNLALFGLDLNLWYAEEVSESAKAASAAKEAQKNAELEEWHDKIIAAATEKINGGTNKDTVYAAIEKISGKKNPKAIKDVSVCEAVLDAIEKL